MPFSPITGAIRSYFQNLPNIPSSTNPPSTDDATAITPAAPSTGISKATSAIARYFHRHTAHPFHPTSPCSRYDDTHRNIYIPHRLAALQSAGTLSRYLNLSVLPYFVLAVSGLPLSLLYFLDALLLLWGAKRGYPPTVPRWFSFLWGMINGIVGGLIMTAWVRDLRTVRGYWRGVKKGENVERDELLPLEKRALAVDWEKQGLTGMDRYLQRETWRWMAHALRGLWCMSMLVSKIMLLVIALIMAWREVRVKSQRVFFGIQGRKALWQM